MRKNMAIRAANKLNNILMIYVKRNVTKGMSTNEQASNRARSARSSTWTFG
ncbi:hypothetical protein VCR5J5_1560003 [Vibrio crassostreae]|uniref:Uncharacterized protein n=1 Tax=Vibrio crassostreae TaxID=246167 RepID=A0A822MYG5_9VIBR|nr:hypothetical protein VCR5J5_1560003 [Vibrio crassostreae]